MKDFQIKKMRTFAQQFTDCRFTIVTIKSEIPSDKIYIFLYNFGFRTFTF